MDRVGRQSPTVSVILPYTETKGPEAVELYNISENSILPWQEALIYDIMAVDGGGLWVHQKFGYSVPRRNGKSAFTRGKKWSRIKQSQSGFNDLSLEEGGGYIVHFGEDGVLQYHPPGGIHKIAYWKVNNGRRGKHWYDTAGRECFFGKKY